MALFSFYSLMDWKGMFALDVPVLEMVIRGSVIYLSLLLMLRFLLKREVGSMGITDLLLLVLLADAAQNAMAGEYKSITDGLVLVGTIVFWNYTLDFLAFKSPAFRRILTPSSIQLVRDGQLLRRNLRRERITEEELMGEIRAAGVGELSEVKAAYIESDGTISVIKKDEAPAASSGRSNKKDKQAP